MITILLAVLFALTTPANAQYMCEFHQAPPEGCDLGGNDPSIGNCMMAENDTPYFAEIGIDGLCPVGSGRAVFVGIPSMIDTAPADPTVGAKAVLVPGAKAYVFLPQAYMRGKFRAKLWTQSPDFPVGNAQFVPATTYVAPPRQNGPVQMRPFCAEYNMFGRGTNWVRIKEGMCY